MKKIDKNSIAIIVGTRNRLILLQNLIYSIFSQTKNKFTIHIIDCGSTDGTVSYLRSLSNKNIRVVYEIDKRGQSISYNSVFNTIKDKYICWLSDDNLITNNGIDTAIRILNEDSKIGMVALKTKDVIGPFKNSPYIGGISVLGVLNVNQGVIRSSVLRRLRGFDEDLTDYGIDPDLTFRVIQKGHKIVYTKKISILHYRQWSDDPKSSEFLERKEKIKNSLIYYSQKYKVIDNVLSGFFYQKSTRLIKYVFGKNPFFMKYALYRDTYNIVRGKYISLFDFFESFGKQYHLIQDPSRYKFKILHKK